MSDKPIPYVGLPEVCGSCMNAVLKDATDNPQQSHISVFCPHGQALVTAQIGDHEGKRVIYAWNVTGPLNEQQAVTAIKQAAAAYGADVVSNHGTARVH